jgi:hypothetical protein
MILQRERYAHDQKNSFLVSIFDFRLFSIWESCTLFRTVCNEFNDTLMK